MMKNKTYILFIALSIFYSCTQKKEPVVQEAEFADIAEVLSGIDNSLLSYEYVIIVPENACSGCIALTFLSAEELWQTQKVAIITEVSASRFEIPDHVKQMSLESVKRDMEIHGLTIVKDSAGYKKLIYLDPHNIRDEYRKITSDPDMFKNLGF